MPTFHDLSSLPEPAEAPTVPQSTTPEPCKDLQVWRPIGSGYGRDQSRFFPPRSLLTEEELETGPSKRFKVKLPPTVACRLHRSDNGSETILPMPNSSITQEATATFVESHDTTPPPVSACGQSQYHDSTSSFCANEVLCRTTISSPDPVVGIMNETAGTELLEINQNNRHSVSDMTMGSSNTTLMTPCVREDHRPLDYSPPYYNAEQPPYELDGREIELPYVHANSLTGISNDLEVKETLPSYEELQFLADSGVGLPVVFCNEQEDMVGLNELVVDHDIMAPIHAIKAANVPLPVSLPATPPATPPSYSFGNLAAILPIDCITEAEHRDSDAHYHSEQALFDQPPTSPTQSTGVLYENLGVNSINIADFLKLGHAKHCWCGHCTDERYNSSHDESSVSISSSITLTDRSPVDDEDGSLVLSLMLNPSESEPDTVSDPPELLNHGDAVGSATKYTDGDVQAMEDDGWLLFSHVMTKPAEERASSLSPLYLPSSPILHRQSEQRAPASTVIITPSETATSELSNDYVAVAAPTTSIATNSTATRLTGDDMFPQRPRTTRESGPALYEAAGNGCVFAKAAEGSWRWGRESEEDWWDWAVEEEC